MWTVDDCLNVTGDSHPPTGEMASLKSAVAAVLVALMAAAITPASEQLFCITCTLVNTM